MVLCNRDQRNRPACALPPYPFEAVRSTDRKAWKKTSDENRTIQSWGISRVVIVVVVEDHHDIEPKLGAYASAGGARAVGRRWSSIQF